MSHTFFLSHGPHREATVVVSSHLPTKWPSRAHDSHHHQHVVLPPLPGFSPRSLLGLGTEHCHLLPQPSSLQGGPPIAPHKLAPRSSRCLFLRCSSGHKGYWCLYLLTHRVIISCHVVFDEDVFPLADCSPPPDLDTLMDFDPIVVPPLPSPTISPTPLTGCTASSPLPTPRMVPPPPTVPHEASSPSTSPRAAPSPLTAPCIDVHLLPLPPVLAPLFDTMCGPVASDRAMHRRPSSSPTPGPSAPLLHHAWPRRLRPRHVRPHLSDHLWHALSILHASTSNVCGLVHCSPIPTSTPCPGPLP
jgi:hypothetical protein